MIEKDNLLIADEGMMLTNGEAYGKTVRIGRCGRAESWYEITHTEYEKIMEEKEKEIE